jgi:small conductance mechanosensitive channel
MRHRFLRTPTILGPALLSAVLLCGPAWAQEPPPVPDEPAGQIGVGGTEISDDAIALRILRMLRAMQGYEGVTIDVTAGVVTLQGEVVDAAALEALTRVVTRVEGVVAVDSRVTETADIALRLAPAWERLRVRAMRILVNVPIFLVALLTFGLIAGAGWLATTRLSIWDRLAPNAFIAEIYRTVARIGFGIAGLVVALDILNATALLGAVLGAAGVAGLALGFAVRDTIENFIASILLSLRQPFGPRDFVDIDGVQGSVARLTSRATILVSPDGNQIRIPNAAVYKGTIVNFTRDPQRRFTFTLAVDGTADLARALASGAETLEALPFVLRDPPVSVWIADVADGRATLGFAAWTDQRRFDFGKARSEGIRLVKRALEDMGVGLPVPTYRLVSGAEPPPPARSGGPAPTATAALPVESRAEPDKVVERERRAGDASHDLLKEDGARSE